MRKGLFEFFAVKHSSLLPNNLYSDYTMKIQRAQSLHKGDAKKTSFYTLCVLCALGRRLVPLLSGF